MLLSWVCSFVVRVSSFSHACWLLVVYRIEVADVLGLIKSYIVSLLVYVQSDVAEVCLI